MLLPKRDVAPFQGAKTATAAYPGFAPLALTPGYTMSRPLAGAIKPLRGFLLLHYGVGEYQPVRHYRKNQGVVQKNNNLVCKSGNAHYIIVVSERKRSAGLAQLVEQWNHNPRVIGPNPIPGTILYSNPCPFPRAGIFCFMLHPNLEEKRCQLMKLEICEFSLITLGDLIDVQGFCIILK